MRQLLEEWERNAPILIFIGAALILSGWGASMTLAGAQLVWFGSGLVILGALLAHSLKWFVVSFMILFVAYVGLPIVLTLSLISSQ
jgi:hypothetical protein